MQKYRKSIVAVVGVVLTGLAAFYGNKPVVELIISLAVALGVYHVPNA